MQAKEQNFLVSIGLEIHAQLKTQSKLFSPDRAGFNPGENQEIHPVSLALPGTLPVLNEEALKMAFKTGKAVQGCLKKKSVFSRKNYFYPDLPKGYQISQYDKPFCEGGFIQFFHKNQEISIALERIHIEEDAGRSLHKGNFSLINYNRAGTPLLEIVTKPVISDPYVASQCVKAIRRLLRYLEVCDGNLEEGSMRCDCNISVRPEGQKQLGAKVELKNINSFRFIEKALFYEKARQIECLKLGQALTQETRLYDSTKNQTKSMRSKESARDYRYFPDPDLPELDVSENFLNQLDLPELPFDKTQRFVKEYKFTPDLAQILVEDFKQADYFEQVVLQTKNPQALSLWFRGEIQAHLKEKNQRVCPIPVKDFARLLNLIDEGDISNTMAKDIFSEMWNQAKSPDQIIKEKNLKQISSDSKLKAFAQDVLNQNPKQVQDYKQGRSKLFGFFIGQVMKKTKGQANPQKLSHILKQLLEDC
ncbi:MAG: Asp-tRNA(Asn)/Glu-tRNA(Gln) amidotransferase subunit GatB [Bdellovibrionales bacterium]|nr:Asp-tRNA(Asn)/Glu-tRNA(Gln) amidotransferase subunit GatB [Bdellovibrionales bacterium]